MTILITAIPPLALRTGKRGPKLTEQQTSRDREQKIGHSKSAASFFGQLGRVELHTTEGCIAAENPGQNEGVQYHAVAIAVVPIDSEQHGKVSNKESARDVDQERAERKVTVIVLPNQTPDPPAQYRTKPTAEADPHRIQRLHFLSPEAETTFTAMSLSLLAFLRQLILRNLIVAEIRRARRAIRQLASRERGVAIRP
jgi:hypothetical protein